MSDSYRKYVSPESRRAGKTDVCIFSMAMTFRQLCYLCRAPILCIVLVFPFLPYQVSASILSELYFFYPDSSQNNLSRLKKDADIFFRKKKYGIRFQPFLHLRDFEKEVRNKKPAFLFVPYWYYEQNSERLGLVSFVKPIQKGKDSYQKYLIVRKQSDFSLNSIEEYTLAMTALGSGQEGFLKSIFPQKASSELESLQIIHTSKDADALFAVALRQVDAAIVAESTLEKVKTINSRLTKNIKITAKSISINLPVMCYLNGVADADEIMRLKSIMLGDRGNDSLGLASKLQFSKWVSINE